MAQRPLGITMPLKHRLPRSDGKMNKSNVIAITAKCCCRRRKRNFQLHRKGSINNGAKRMFGPMTGSKMMVEKFTSGENTYFVLFAKH
jgi:hypothetical protein